MCSLRVCVCVTNSLGLSALRSGTYHGSHGTSRPGIAFRGQVYQPTEMALVMNGGTVSTETRHAPLHLHLLPHSVLVRLVDAHGPNQLHRTSAVVMWRKDPERRRLVLPEAYRERRYWSPRTSHSVGSVEAKYYRWMCLCFFAHVRDIHIIGTFAVLFLDVVWVRGRHTLYVCNRSSISRRIILHCDIESNASKTTFGHLWKSASYTHRANTAFVT